MTARLHLVGPAPDTTPEPDTKLVAAVQHILDLVYSGRVKALAFVLLLEPNGSGPIPYEADVVGEMATHRLLARGVCKELEDLVSK